MFGGHFGAAPKSTKRIKNLAGKHNLYLVKKPPKNTINCGSSGRLVQYIVARPKLRRRQFRGKITPDSGIISRQIPLALLSPDFGVPAWLFLKLEGLSIPTHLSGVTSVWTPLQTKG
jgi:hypothetical protein